MTDQTTHPLIFDCYKCKAESKYPNTLKKGNDNPTAKTVVKRCTTCSAENTIQIPEGYYIANTTSILRGFKKDD